VFVSGAGTGGGCIVGDADSDGICDDEDNCLGMNNPVQYDADYDGYGNICDHDVDNDCIVGIPDISATIAAFNTPAPHQSDVKPADLVVGIPDISSVIAEFNQPFGPSGKSCQACPSPVGVAAGACP
jgi:hypothetical protein